MTKEQATRLVEIYGKAWETQDPDLIVTIFTDDATYDDPHEPRNDGIAAIRSYWETKVVRDQKDIHFTLLNVWMDGDTVIAEWEAGLIDIPQQVRRQLWEVAIFTVRGDKFSSLREYYKTAKTPL